MRETPIVRARSGLVPTLGGSSSKTPRKREAAAVVTRVASSSQPSWRIGGTFKRIKAGFLVSVKIEVPEPQLEGASISRSHSYITGTLCTPGSVQVAPKFKSLPLPSMGVRRVGEAEADLARDPKAHAEG